MAPKTLSKTDRQNAKVDEKILHTIASMRGEFQACTLRNLASRMHISETAVRNRMNRMRGEFLDWNSVPGSVHLLPAGMERIGQVVVDVRIVTKDEPVLCSCGEENLLGSAGVERFRVYHRADGPCYYVPPGSNPDEALAALTAGATSTAGPEAAEDHATLTSPEGSPAGTPDTDPNPTPASPSAS